MNFWLILYIIDWVLFAGVTITILYMLIFSIASQHNKHAVVPKAKHLNRFIVLIPSYKDDEAILQTVASIMGQSYPQRMFDAVVISDHQEEITNFRLKQYPITLLTPNFVQSTKAKSLQYAMMNLPQFKIYDVAVVLDSGNIVEQDFLEQVNDAFESAGTRAIQTHRVSKNRDTHTARMDAIFEEINNSIFRRGHIALGLSAAITGSGNAYDFRWFKKNIMTARTAGEDKEIEALLMRQHIYVDYFDDILVFDEKTRQARDFNKQRGRWATTQFHQLFKNIRFLPAALYNKQYDLVDKILQWMLIPRTILVGIICLMSIALPFIYFTLAIKWWIIGAIGALAFAIATPNYLVDDKWDATFARAPFIIIAGFLNIFGLFRREKSFINDNSDS